MNAVIYARYSCDNQREESIEGQIRECSQFAEKSGMNVVYEYIDRAFSAKTDNRPEFQKMIKDSYSNKFQSIIVWKLDRFARNRYDSARYKAILKKNNVEVVSAGIYTDSVKEKLLELEQQKEDLEKQLQIEQDKLSSKKLSFDQIKYWLHNILALISEENKSLLVETFVDEIVYFNDD